MERGDVIWYTFAPPDKRRPVVVLTRTDAIPYLERVVVASVTTTVRNIPSEVVIDEADGMPARSAINLDNIACVSKERLDSRLSRITNLDASVL